MIIVKIINQKVVSVAVANQLPMGQLFGQATKMKQKYLIRTLVQSAHQNQKVTTANNQQALIPIARNIYFRQTDHPCRKPESNASFSIAAMNSDQSHFISADFGSPSGFIYDEETETSKAESPLEALKRKAKGVVEKREQTPNKYYGQSFNETLTTTTTERKLVVLMSWLEAKEKHIEKYRQFYLDRGFDVLNVKTSPLDLLLPSVGAMKISRDFVRFMVEKQYSDVLIHGFSVGGFMFGQCLLDIDRQAEQVRDQLLNSIRGLVFDSLVPFEGTCIGVANSITRNKVLAKVLESLLRGYLAVGHSIATKHYLKVSDKVWGGPLRCPSLFFMSKDDIISDHKIVERLSRDWSNMGISTSNILFDSAPHVQNFTKHHDVYVEEVEKFLKQIKMN